MKRKYTRPYLLVEPYQLDASVAAACSTTGGIPIYYGESTCTDRTEEFFSYQCETDLVNGECYHGPYVTGGMIFVMS